MSRLKTLLVLVCFVVLLLSFCRCSNALTPIPPVHARSLAFSPDGKLVAALGVPVKTGPWNSIVNDHGAQIWTVADGKGYRRYPWALTEAGGMAFSSDSQYLALPAAGGIKIVHLPTNVIQDTLATHIVAEKINFSPDGKWFVVQGPWEPNAKTDGPQVAGHRDFEIWQLATRDDASRRSERRIVTRDFDIAYSPISGPEVTSATPSIPQWCISPSEKYLWSQIRSNDNKWQAFGKENTVQLWDASSCTQKSTLLLPERKEWDTIGTLLLFSPKNRWLIGEHGSKLFVWSVVGATRTDLDTSWGKYVVSPDENLVAITCGVWQNANYSPILVVYDLNTGQKLPVVFE